MCPRKALSNFVEFQRRVHVHPSKLGWKGIDHCRLFTVSSDLLFSPDNVISQKKRGPLRSGHFNDEPLTHSRS